MCRAVTCRRCGNITWAGCGLHVERVLAGVPQERRCRCEPAPPTPARATPPLLARLRRRRSA